MSAMKKAKIAAAGDSAASSAAASSAAAAASSSSSSIGASASQWVRPSAHDLAQSVHLFRSVPPKPKGAADASASGGSKQKKRKSAEPPAVVRPEWAAASQAAAHDVNRYLLLAAGSAILEINTAILGDGAVVVLTADGEKPLETVYRGPQRCIEQIIGAMGAQVDFQDPATGFSAVHWLIFDALERGKGEAVVSGEGASRTVDLSGLTRYAVEPTLETLLRYSEYVKPRPYFNVWRADCDTDENAVKEQPSLMDLQDRHGNTPLHWAVHERRVDLVGMLLMHRANVSIKNKAGQTPFDMVDWDAKTTETAGAAAMDVDEGAAAAPAAAKSKAASSAASGAASSSSSAAAASASASSIYASQGHALERRWGTHEGLRIDQCSYVGESDSAAIKRLLFQVLLFNAVDEGDDGSLPKVKELVAQWKNAETKGKKRMWPLVYRSDVAWHHPLRICVAYLQGDTAILEAVLQLPINLHIQSAIPLPHALHEACGVDSPTAREKLLAAGCDINVRDLHTGATALAQLFTILKDEEENPAAFNHRLLTTAQWLTKNGADPRVCTDLGNDALSFLVFRPEPGRLPALQHLLEVVSASDPKWVREHTNSFGSTLLHYALCQRFDAECQVEQLAALIKAGARVDGPQNRAGQVPLQCFAGLKSPSRVDKRDNLGAKYAGRALMLLKIARSEDEALVLAQQAVLGAARPKLPAHSMKTLVADLAGGEATAKVHLKSDFADSSADSVAKLLHEFKYSPIHVGTASVAESWPEYEHHLEQLFFLRESRSQLESYTRLRARLDPMTDDPLSSCKVPLLISLSKLELRETAHKGLGLFAAQTIPAESEDSVRGIECCGELVTPAEAEARERAYALQGEIGFVYRADKIRNPSSLSANRAMLVDQRHRGNLSRFINHSCAPNCHKFLISNDQRIVIYPIGEKEIRKDEELTINYFEGADPGQWVEPAHTIVCQCESNRCRRKLVAIPDE